MQLCRQCAFFPGYSSVVAGVQWAVFSRRVAKTRPPFLRTSTGAGRNPSTSICFFTFLAVFAPSCTANSSDGQNPGSFPVSCFRLNELYWVAVSHAWRSEESWFRRCFSLSMSMKAGRVAWMSSPTYPAKWFLPRREHLCMAVLSSTKVATITEDHAGHAGTTASQHIWGL